METKTEKLDEMKFKQGKPLPEGFKNPAPGENGHKCVDMQGNYAPHWTCVRVEKGPHVQSHLPFSVVEGQGEKPKSYNLKTGEWVDVPVGIVSTLEMLQYDEIEMDMNKASPLSDEHIETVIKRVPAFQFSTRQSA